MLGPNVDHGNVERNQSAQGEPLTNPKALVTFIKAIEALCSSSVGLAMQYEKFT